MKSSLNIQANLFTLQQHIFIWRLFKTVATTVNVSVNENETGLSTRQKRIMLETFHNVKMGQNPFVRLLLDFGLEKLCAHYAHLLSII